MRSNEEQLQEILRRSETVKEKRILRRRLQASTAASFVCALLLVIVSVYLPRLDQIS